MTKCKDCKYFNTLEDICFCNILFQRFIAGKCMSDEIYVDKESTCKIMRNAIKTDKKEQTAIWVVERSNRGDYWYSCSNCNYTPQGAFGQQKLTDICPKCGCKMKNIR